MSNIPISKMNDKQLRNAVQELYDAFARFKRDYEDGIYNLDSDNLGKRFTIEQNNMKAQIKVTADAIKTMVSETDLTNTLLNYSTITQTANEIKSTVTKEYVNDLVGDDYVTNAAFETAIEQTSDKIEMTVNATYSNPEETSSFYAATADKDKVYYDTSTSLYWFYNGSKWVSSENGNFGSVFEQTVSGFALKGNVSISGDLITEGTISANRLSTEIAQVNKTLNIGSSTYDGAKQIIFSSAARLTTFLDGYGYTGLSISGSTVKIGNVLDLSDCSEIVWGDNAPSGGTTTVVFG